MIIINQNIHHTVIQQDQMQLQFIVWMIPILIMIIWIIQQQLILLQLIQNLNTVVNIIVTIINQTKRKIINVNIPEADQDQDPTVIDHTTIAAEAGIPVAALAGILIIEVDVVIAVAVVIIVITAKITVAVAVHHDDAVDHAHVGMAKHYPN